MHKIYFEKRCIIICPPDELALADPNAILFNIGSSEDIHDLVEMVEISESHPYRRRRGGIQDHMR